MKYTKLQITQYFESNVSVEETQEYCKLVLNILRMTELVSVIKLRYKTFAE